MLKLGKAQGVAIAAALSRSIPFEEYAPKKIKMSITGKGTSSKEQVAGMLVHILKIKNLPEPLDATDALATAVCHHYQSNSPTGGKKYSGWDSFLKNNPNKFNNIGKNLIVNSNAHFIYQSNQRIRTSNSLNLITQFFYFKTPKLSLNNLSIQLIPNKQQNILTFEIVNLLFSETSLLLSSAI